MYLCRVITYSKSKDQSGKAVNPARGQLNRENCFSSVPVRANWSLETGSAVPSRVSLLISILRLNLVLTYGIPPKFRGGVHLYIETAIRHRVSPEISGHAIAYRWRSLPRVRRHRASKPQDSSKRMLPWQVAVDQLIFASLSHTHYWFEVGMLRVKYTVLYCSKETAGGDGPKILFLYRYKKKLEGILQAHAHTPISIIMIKRPR